MASLNTKPLAIEHRPLDWFKADERIAPAPGGRPGPSAAAHWACLSTCPASVRLRVPSEAIVI
jgi:hypothetical protein